MGQESDFYPIILELSASQSEMSVMDLDELLPIEQEEKSTTISFSEYDSVMFVESSEEWTEEEREKTWFSSFELDGFRREARQLCLIQSHGFVLSEQHSTRGMDIYFPSRKEAHKQYVHYILKAYYEQCKGNADQVAHFAEKWSRRNTERAITEGISDMCEVYFPHMLGKAECQYIPKNSPIEPCAVALKTILKERH